MAQNDFKTENESRPALIRAMGRWDLTAVGVNQVIGSGYSVEFVAMGRRWHGECADRVVLCGGWHTVS